MATNISSDSGYGGDNKSQNLMSQYGLAAFQAFLCRLKIQHFFHQIKYP